MRNLEQANENANYGTDVNKRHRDMNEVFRTPIYLLKNAENEVFHLASEHVAICQAIMQKKDLQTTFIKNVRRSPNGNTNLYYIRQFLAKIDKLGFTKAIESIEKAKIKAAAKKAAKESEVAPTAKKAAKKAA